MRNHADQPENEQTTTNKANSSSQVTIAAVGDVMMHTSEIQTAKQGNLYNFRPFFQDIKPYLSSTDFTVANLELTLAGSSKPYSGYPAFNAPDEVLDAVKDSGINILTTANNHANDTGEQGVIRTHNMIKKKGFLTTGTATSPAERKGILVEKNGIKIGFLAYTEKINGLKSLPKNKAYLINQIDLKRITSDIKQIKHLGAQFVIVSMHWGIEYQRTPTVFQKQTAVKVFQAGADVILGSHPHVQQQMEKMMVGGKQKLIIYSMGNFISNQSNPFTDEGVIIYFNIAKDPKTGVVSLTKTSFLPTVVDRYKQAGKMHYLIVPLISSKPKNLKNYPSLTAQKWETAWSDTDKMMTHHNAFPVFSQSQ